MNVRYYISVSTLVGLIGMQSCVEPFEADELGYERLLVVEGTITDEVKRQKILLSYTSPLDTLVLLRETGASVQIKTSDNRTYSFAETEPGIYESQLEFGAEEDTGYQLEITTSSGDQIVSDECHMARNPGIDAVYAGKELDTNGNEEMVIYIDSQNSSADVSFYRFEFEETYQLIAPRWSPFDFVVINDVFPFFEVGLVLREREERVCYGSKRSTEIIQGATQALSENRLVQYPVHRLSKDDYKIAHRYSIEVRQFTQTADAHAFYETLNELSSVTNLFSTLQPGRLEGNVRSASTTGPDILGYFEVAAVSSVRIFVNYNDVFEGQPGTIYPINCEPLGSPPLFPPGGHPMGLTNSPLIDAIQAGVIKYVADNAYPGEGQGPYFTTTTPCGDCNEYGTNVKPEFWID